MSRARAQSGPSAYAALFAEKRTLVEQELRARVDEAVEQEQEITRRCAEKKIPHKPMVRTEIVAMVKYEIACEHAPGLLYADDDPMWA